MNFRGIRGGNEVKIRMEATKNFRYGTRALRAGDIFTIGSRDGKILQAVRKATPYLEREPQKPSPPPEDLKQDDLDSLREQARSVGIEVDARWRETRLRKEIAASQDMEEANESEEEEDVNESEEEVVDDDDDDDEANS